VGRSSLLRPSPFTCSYTQRFLIYIFVFFSLSFFVLYAEYVAEFAVVKGNSSNNKNQNVAASKRLMCVILFSRSVGALIIAEDGVGRGGAVRCGVSCRRCRFTSLSVPHPPLLLNKAPKQKKRGVCRTPRSPNEQPRTARIRHAQFRTTLFDCLCVSL
jgi:hypothetical protein